MALITRCGMFANEIANKDELYIYKAFKKTRIGKACVAADFLLGITAVVLGTLALLKILPIPPSMAEPFGYGAIAAGGLNLLTSIANQLWDSAKKWRIKRNDPDVVE